MLEKLHLALHTAFGDRVTMRHVSDQMLAIRIGAVELLINEYGKSVGVSGFGASGHEVDVDGGCGVIPAP